MKIAVVGTGYVGLVSGTCFAETGNTVTCVDVDENKIKKLNNGEITIYEPGLEKLFLRNQREERLKFTTNLAEAVKEALIIILALPTPPNEDDSADLTHVLQVADDLGKIISDYKIVVDKSTVPVGTAEKVRDAIAKNYKGKFDVVANPEFLREGFAVEDFMKPDRVVVGTRSEKAKKVLTELYAPFMRQDNRIIFMDERSAELTKYAANSFLAVKISFMNEIANLCEKLGADVDLIRRGIGADERIGKRFLFPGIGYGGSCFPKDVKALAKAARKVNYDFKILEATMQVNEKQKLLLLPRIKKFFGNNLKGRRIAVWGLAFKPNTDDTREAPAFYIIEELLKEGAALAAFDPEAMNNAKKHFGNRVEFKPQYEAIENCDALIIATEWSEFRTPDFDKMKKLMKGKVIFDGRNVYQTERMKELGFYYESIGRETVAP
ncbi:MAG: UDP-glucose 6-dehydrogenase [Chitinophagaceae bacterium]